MQGYVYIISNKAMPDLLKVGFTTRSPDERAAELSGTALPYPSVVEYSVLVDHAAVVEREVHRRLASLRVSQNREWFQCSRTKAIETVKAAAGSVVKADKDRAVEEERQRAVHEQWRRENEQRLRQELEAQARKEAYEASRKAIFDKYASQLATLSRVPRFYVFWLMGGAIVSALLLLSLPANKEPSFAFFVISFLIGAIPGTVLKELAEGQKMKSSGYVSVQAKRDAELAALQKRSGLSS
ncbi:GIY-YIG nuclease family protein [Paraburkholderia sp. BL17N1]|uniref:GIY-YIG nuclease family protein n=1 Tax=Paraburkholderia sp. BL17N1 TaxID=1938798 RepID=UPI000EB4D76D|nr:GIY-YIG nuclease family protein [Paraburkholderia sp. BL17N1]RKR31218.1 T5orf172 domain-containing protein [Paraburkholderia sp. BL17N1]